MKTKKWYESKLVLTGLSAIALAVMTWVQTGGTKETLAIGVLGAIVTVLRTVTNTAITK
jgi:hypothetical protein